MALFDIFKKKKVNEKISTMSKPTDKNHNCFGEDITRLTEEGELPWGWRYANRDFTEEIERQYSHFLDTYINAKKENKGVRAVHAALKSFVMFMDDVESLCKSKGECFQKWSEIQIADPSTMNSYKETLKHMEENMDELIRKEKYAKQMNADLLKIIKEEPGIVQADLYKRFDAELKGDVSSELYRLSASGVITREKSGRSYKLYLK